MGSSFKTRVALKWKEEMRLLLLLQFVHDDDDDDAKEEEGGRPPWVDHLPNAKTWVINAKRCSDGAESRTCQSSQPQ